MARIEAELVIDAGRAVVSLGGGLDASNAHRLGALLRRLISEGCTDIVLDLGAVTRVDASAIGILRGASSAVRRGANGRLWFCNASDEISAELRDNGLSGLDERIDEGRSAAGASEQPVSAATTKPPRESHSRSARQQGRTTRSRVPRP